MPWPLPVLDGQSRKAAADGQIDVLFHRPRAFDADQPGPGREPGAKGASPIEPRLIELEISEQAFDPLRISHAVGLGQTNGGKDLLSLPTIELMPQSVDQPRMVREGALQGLGQMPPIQLVGGAPAVMAREGFDPVCAISDQQEMARTAEAEVGFAFEEQALVEVLGGFDSAVAYPLLQAVVEDPDQGGGVWRCGSPALCRW